MEVHGPPERVLIHTDADGVIRVGGARVTLDTVVAAFDAGATPEGIAQQYPSVGLADVYSVIVYYLRHQAEVRAHLAQRQLQAAQVRQENERRVDPAAVRDRLLTRPRVAAITSCEWWSTVPAGGPKLTGGMARPTLTSWNCMFRRNSRPN